MCVDVEGGRRGERAESLVRQASGIDESWLPETMLHTVSDVAFDEKLERVTGTVRRMYRDLVLSEKSVTPPLDQALAAARRARRGRPARALNLEDEDVQRFLARVRSLAVWMPELALPAFDDADTGRRSRARLRRATLLRRDATGAAVATRWRHGSLTSQRTGAS